MALHRERADAEAGRDLERGPPIRKRGQDLPFARREHADRSGAQGRLGRERGRGNRFGRQDQQPRGDVPDRLDEAVRRGVGAHESRGPGGKRERRKLRRLQRADAEEPDRWPRPPDETHDPHAVGVDAIEVDDHDVDGSGSQPLENVARPGRRCDHSDFRPDLGHPASGRERDPPRQLRAVSHDEDPDSLHLPHYIGSRSGLTEGWDTARVTPQNRLAGETSPYLLQHAGNPVDWYPWGPEALARAEAEDRPIFLSIGYAACHWCHVMERESFEDEETARLLNERFVAIKVDREERPDLDAIYMDAVQALTGQGGWPLSVFLAPDGRAFYGGTYFPPVPRHGMPAFRQILGGIADAWRERRAELLEQGDRVLSAIGRTGALRSSGTPLSPGILDEALAGLRHRFDPQWGGFGGAPKFPQTMTLEFALRMSVREPSGLEPDGGLLSPLHMLEFTLDRMAAGGLRDHVGGGFARYSTDPAWHVPHFEKMLYDNAQLALVYTHAWLRTRSERHRQVAVDTLEYLLREMRDPDGGFWSSEDADSEGVEGKFFAWTWSELLELAGEPAARAFGALPEGNWEGTNVLWHPTPLGEIAAELGMSVEDLQEDVERARNTLRAARERRVRPATDDKVLTAWNALAIRAFAEAGRAFAEPRYIEAAAACASFVRSALRDDSGRLLRSWRRGVAGRRAFADDHALLGLACLALYEATGDLNWFDEARELGDRLLERFLDPEAGGFFQTADDDERLVVRPKDLEDNAVPSANSAAAELLVRLSLLTGEAELEDRATAALGLVGDVLARAPTGFGHALCALDLLLGPTYEVAILGEPGDAATRTLVGVVAEAAYRPNVVLAVASPADTRAPEHVALLRDRTALEGRPTAYVCRRFACRLPVTTPAELAAQLDGP